MYAIAGRSLAAVIINVAAHVPLATCVAHAMDLVPLLITKNAPVVLVPANQAILVPLVHA
jgi:hypothetical protein